MTHWAVLEKFTTLTVTLTLPYRNPNRTSGDKLLHYRRPIDPSKSYGSMSRDTLKCVFSTSVRINKVSQLINKVPQLSSQYFTYRLSTVSSREISLKTSLTLYFILALFTFAMSIQVLTTSNSGQHRVKSCGPIKNKQLLRPPAHRLLCTWHIDTPLLARSSLLGRTYEAYIIGVMGTLPTLLGFSLGPNRMI